MVLNIKLNGNNKLKKNKTMAVNKVDLYVSQILEDLNNGITWLKRDDVGYGSIQEKYNAKDQQIAMIRKHPKLKDAETNVTVFNVIDDTASVKEKQTINTPVAVKKELETATEETSAEAFANL
jgi:hypothetical protein